MSEHIFKRFDEELDKLKSRLIRMGSVVQEQIESVLRALKDGNTALAGLIIERDNKVDAMDIKIDKQCMRLFALQQPVAMDLRLIMSALTLNNNIERLGDLAVNVAERVQANPGLHSFLGETRLLEMGTQAEKMVADSLDSFINSDANLARAVLEMDKVVDRLDRENFQILIDMMKSDRDMIDPCSHLMIVNRNLERMADQATNIAEEVIFLLDAKIIKHQSLEEQEGFNPIDVQGEGGPDPDNV